MKAEKLNQKTGKKLQIVILMAVGISLVFLGAIQFSKGSKFNSKNLRNPDDMIKIMKRQPDVIRVSNDIKGAFLILTNEPYVETNSYRYISFDYQNESLLNKENLTFVYERKDYEFPIGFSYRYHQKKFLGRPIGGKVMDFLESVFPDLNK